MNEFERALVRAMEAKTRRDEETVRRLLERWVSELEPAVAYRDGEIIGLTIADAPLGSCPPILRVEDSSDNAGQDKRGVLEAIFAAINDAYPIGA
jgi:hypothetical protein